jgi:putative transposase
MSNRHMHSPEFKARLAMEAIRGYKTFQEFAAVHAIDPIQVSQWNNQFPESVSELFTRGRKTKEKGEGQPKEEKLFLRIGRLQIELE